jgi:hypothetical protein
MTAKTRVASKRDRGINPPARWCLTAGEVRVVRGPAVNVRLGYQDGNEFTGFWYDASGAEHGFVALAVP